MTKEDIRIVFMGTPEFAVTILDGLLQHNYTIAGVITAPIAQQVVVKKFMNPR